MAARRRRLALCCCALAALATATCDGPDGTDPYALWETFDQGDGAFHFHYPAPPWKRGDGHGSLHAVLVLDPRDDPEASGPGARMRLEAWTEAGRTPADAFEARRQVWEALEYLVEEPGLWENGVGDRGVIVLARGGESWVREVMIPGEEGVVLMSVWGGGDPDDPDLDLLLDGFEPRPSREAP